jgi:hypothetical protein
MGKKNRIVGVEISPLGTSATTGLLYLPRVVAMMMENLVEWRNQSTQRKPAPAPLCPPQIPLSRPELEPGPTRWEAKTNRLSYGAVFNMGKSGSFVCISDFNSACV